jgi:hypothetical protein
MRDVLRRATPRAEPILTTPRQLDGNTVTWSERTDARLITAADVTVRAVVENGRIQALTYRPGRTSVGPAAPAPTTVAAAGFAFGGIVLLACGLLSLATIRVRRVSGSRLRGSLLSDLHHWRSRAAA